MLGRASAEAAPPGPRGARLDEAAPPSAGVDFSTIPLLAPDRQAAAPPPSAPGPEASPLPLQLRRRLEVRIGAPLDGVGLHRGPAAQRAAAALHARAFTLGPDIVLGADIDPAAPQAFPLLAHEAAHAAQQAGAAPRGALSRTRPGDEAEREADDSAFGLRRPRPRALAIAAAPAAPSAPAFKTLWSAFEQARGAFDDAKALDLARQLAAMPSKDFDDILQHGIALAGFLQTHGEPALAAKTLDEVRDAYEISFVTTGHKLPPLGFASAGSDPDKLIELGEAAARDGRDAEAQHFLGAANEILSYYAEDMTNARLETMQADSDAEAAIAKAEGPEKARLQAIHASADLPRTIGRVSQYSDLGSIYDAMRRVYGVYSKLEREALARGDAARAAAARSKSDELHRVLREKYSWGATQPPGPIGHEQTVEDPVETAEVSYVDTPRGPGLRLHGVNNAETDLTPLPGLPSPKEVGNNVQVQNLGNLQQALVQQSDFQAELAREPAIRAAFGDKPVDLNDTAQRQKAWLIMYGAFAAAGGDPLSALMSLIGRYQKAYTIHTTYNVRDWGVSYLDSTMPTDLAGRVEKDCGVYALTVAWDVFETAKRGAPKLNLGFELFSMLEHVALVITDRATNAFYVVNNDEVSGPFTGDKLAKVASIYQGVRGLAYTVGPTVPVALGTTASTERAFHDAAWERYKASADWGLAPPVSSGASSAATPAATRDDVYRDFYARQEAFDRGARALDLQIDALAAKASDPAGLAAALSPVTDLAGALASQFIQLGPQQRISAGSPATQKLLPPTGSYLLSMAPGHAVHPLARVGRAVLHLQALRAAPTAKGDALVRFCDAVPTFHDALDAYRAAGALGPF